MYSWICHGCIHVCIYGYVMALCMYAFMDVFIYIHGSIHGCINACIYMYSWMYAWIYSFHSDILNSDLIKKPEKDLSALCQQYDSVISSFFDKHAPVSTNTMPKKPPTPCMTLEIMGAKTLRHNLERTWRRSRTHLDRSRYKQQCHLCNRIMTKAKSKYLAEVISENLNNPRQLWNSINNILHRIPPPVKSLCDHFTKCFVDKIETICSKFPDKVQNIPPVQKAEIRFKINVFESASEDEIEKLILCSSSKSCDQDPIPTSVLKNCADILITPITDIINISMDTSRPTFPQHFKEAHVRPLLKKHLFLKTNWKITGMYPTWVSFPKF